MKSLTKRIPVSGTSQIGMLDCPEEIEVVISRGAMERLANIINSKLVDFGDCLRMSLGGIDAYDEDGAVMEMDWRPGAAMLAIYGGITMESLQDGVPVTVECKETGNELLEGRLSLTSDELASLLDVENEHGTFEVWTETTIVRSSEVVSGTIRDIKERVEDGMDDLHQLYDSSEIDCRSETKFRRLSVNEIERLKEAA